jgi:uncharacterized coiled-coil DUF342 family protein
MSYEFLLSVTMGLTTVLLALASAVFFLRQRREMNVLNELTMVIERDKEETERLRTAIEASRDALVELGVSTPDGRSAFIKMMDNIGKLVERTENAKRVNERYLSKLPQDANELREDLADYIKELQLLIDQATEVQSQLQTSQSFVKLGG